MHGLQQAANLEPNKFPIQEIRLPRVKMLVEEMKLAAAVRTPGERDGLIQYLREEVEPRKSSDLTVGELHGHYTIKCQLNMHPAFPRSVFQRVLPGFIKDVFGVIKSHDLQRSGADGSLHWYRGFHGLAFKTAAADAADAPDAASRAAL